MEMHLLSIAVLLAKIILVLGHGRMLEPPQRSSLWRQGYPVEINYNDNELFCGGFADQWTKNEGKCGVCGDPYDGTRENEAGGKYASGVIPRTYRHGQLVPVTIDLTANHLGFFVFHICPHNNTFSAVTEECLKKHPILIRETSSYKYNVKKEIAHESKVNLTLALPSNIWCWQCVLQWKYYTGNSWGCFKNETCCIGCGPQENFVNCADIAVLESGGNGAGSTNAKIGIPLKVHPSQPKITYTNPEPLPVKTEEPVTVETTPENPNELQENFVLGDNDESVTHCPKDMLHCRAVGVWAADHEIETWCLENCPLGNCPTSHCYCICLN